jgi:DNA-directed RNA polymerase subunit N (RpoN/RPB10)|uniref:DNA-directed RNA polymerase n=1 Tax=viral metagenome TaxID=1070528 RepID=A0A6C0J071_9ZZZZ
MIIPVRCYSCGKVLGNKWQNYNELVSQGLPEGKALDEVKLKKYCCRAVMLSHVNLIDKIIKYSK